MEIFSRGIRGAITLDANTEEEIKNATVELVEEIIKQNNVQKEDIAFALFTTTLDLNAAFPAKFARIYCGFKNVPMMCYHELDVKGSLKMCLRVLLNVNTTKKQNEIKHIYLKGASILRQDLK